ncbi:MAG: hypothetical protein RBU37_02310 [Myxococcota bacterium]|jgi:hypothetical protein|nr:hypothetical protein [Myxococcota bacterium]
MTGRRLPPYLREQENQPRQVDDSLFYPSAFLFPEQRDQVYPRRRFALAFGEDAPVDQEIGEIQNMGLQFSVHVQMCREPGLSLKPPSDWDKKQGLWTDLPVFAEELCEWHFPQLTVGYNCAQIEPPAILRPESNAPMPFGFLPNGDIAMYWELAETLADDFELEIEALVSTVDGRCLVSAPGAEELLLEQCPVGQAFDAGVVLARNELHFLDDALAYANACCGGNAFVLKPAMTMFYRLSLPVMQCEWSMNRYADAVFPAVSLRPPRLAGYAFLIIDSPVSRNEPIFSTEKGNVVVSKALFERLDELLASGGWKLGAGQFTPIVRTP